ncbi:MAG: CPBP family intramembrane metalloprotease [Planctomycetes bacterium]|nr:CPBP family intramembrane metalloprotease [Planctomycetota bacterium]
MMPPSASESESQTPQPLPVTYMVARAIDAPKVFPDSTLTRGDALRDLCIVVFLAIAFMTAIFETGFPHWLAQRFPDIAVILPAFLNGAICMGAVAALVRHRRQRAGSIGLTNWHWRWLGIGLLTVPVCFVGGAISNLIYALVTQRSLVDFVKEREEFLGGVSDIPLWLIFTLSIFVGIYEEILFRGFVLTRLRALSKGVIGPVVISSVIFGSLHFTQGLMGVCQTTIVGLVLATVAARSRSLWPCMIAHALIDSTSLVLAGLMSEEMQQFLREAASQPAG